MRALLLILLGGVIALSSMTPITTPVNDPTQSAIPGGGQIIDPASGLLVQAGPSVVPQPQQLSRNPMLPQHPLGAYTDAQYEAAVAQLRAQTMQKYNDVLQQLGYIDPNTGQFIMGSAETAAAQKRSQDDYSEGLARRHVTEQMQQNGTLFSGYRGQREGEETTPFEQDKAQIGIDLPNQLSTLYTQAGNIVSDFINQHNSLLADAASRAAQAAMLNPGSGTAVAVPAGATPPLIGPDPNTTQTNAGLPAVQQIAGLPGTAPVISAGGTPGGVTGSAEVAGALGTVSPSSARQVLSAGEGPYAPAAAPTPQYDPTALSAAARAGRQQYVE